MKASILNKLTTLVERHQELEALLADPAVIADQKQFRELSREYAQLTPVVETFQAYRDTRTEIAAQDRSVRLEVSAPFTSDNTDLYGAAIAGAAGSLVVSDGSVTYTMNFGNAKIPAEGQDVSGKSEIMLPLTVDLFHDDASASELKITKT